MLSLAQCWITQSPAVTDVGFGPCGYSDFERSPLELQSSAFRRFQSMPVPFCGFEASPQGLTGKKTATPDKLTRRPRPVFSLGAQARDVTPERPGVSSCASPLSVLSPVRGCHPLDGTPERGVSPLLDASPEQYFSHFRRRVVAAKTGGSPRGRFSLDDEESSQDSGVGLEKDALKTDCDDLTFKKPMARASRRVRMLSDDVSSPRKLSPLREQNRPISAPAGSLDFSPLPLANNSPYSPRTLRKSSLTMSPLADEGDDGFLEFLETESEAAATRSVEEGRVPACVQGLLSRPVISPHQQQAKPQPQASRAVDNCENLSPTLGCTRRGLFRSQSERHFGESPLGTRPYSYKRLEPCNEAESTPYNSKRRRSVVDTETEEKKVSPRSLTRCHSMYESNVKNAMERCDEQEDYIGDLSKCHSLPLTGGKHQDLKSITAQTMGALMKGEYDHVVESYSIIDCRYPYEFEGGHIKGAENIYRKEDLMAEFLDSTKRHAPSSSTKRNILIFHCEFSSERGPKMSRFLRNKDRDANKECYPSLHYPEIYLLHDGYKVFYEQHKELCTPEEYLPMLHEDHSNDLKHFRAKSKSWAGEKSGKAGRTSLRRGLKAL